MVYGTDLFLGLFNNLAMFVVLVAVYGWVHSRYRDASWRISQTLLGLLFGAFAVACMYVRIPVAEGVIVDQRNTFVVLSGVFGGPVSAVVSGVMVALFRAYLGGRGVLGGIIGVSLSAVAGALIHLIRKRNDGRIVLVISALCASVFILPGFLFLGDFRQGWELMKAMALPYGSAVFIGMSVVGVLLDNEERRVDDAARRRQAETERTRLISAIEQSSELYVITDTEGIIRYVNPSFELVTGYTRDEVIGMNPRILKSGKQDDEFYLEMWQTLKRGETWRGRIINRKKDGALFTEDAVITPLSDESGKTVSYVASKRDVTDSLNLERQLQQAQRTESVGRLAGGIAHDLNNLMLPIIGYSEMLQEELDPNNEEFESVAEILKAGFRARDLIRQLLAFSRNQALEFKALVLDDVVSNMGKLLERTIPEDIELRLSLNAVDRWIMGDVGQMEQVLMNLVVNAADAMPGGGRLVIETSISRIDAEYVMSHLDTKPGTYVILTVSDTGIGMDDETVQHIFEPFYTTKGDHGTGLGLSTVYGIIKQHEGNIWVYSEPGRGTTFRIQLPIYENAMEAAVVSETPGATLEGGETILLVEDNEQVRVLTTLGLRRYGYQVIVAKDGFDGLRLLEEQTETVDLLVTDVVMPGMNGAELYERVREISPDIKVLYMSGYTANIIELRGVLQSGVAFIQKPFTATGLISKVRDVLDRTAD